MGYKEVRVRWWCGKGRWGCGRRHQGRPGASKFTRGGTAHTTKITRGGYAHTPASSTKVQKWVWRRPLSSRVAQVTTTRKF